MLTLQPHVELNAVVVVVVIVGLCTYTDVVNSWLYAEKLYCSTNFSMPQVESCV